MKNTIKNKINITTYLLNNGYTNELSFRSSHMKQIEGSKLNHFNDIYNIEWIEIWMNNNLFMISFGVEIGIYIDNETYIMLNKVSELYIYLTHLYAVSREDKLYY